MEEKSRVIEELAAHFKVDYDDAEQALCFLMRRIAHYHSCEKRYVCQLCWEYLEDDGDGWGVEKCPRCGNKFWWE